MRQIRWLPQEMLDSLAAAANPVLDIFLAIAVFALPLMLLGGIGRAWLQFCKTGRQEEPCLGADIEKKLRTVPLSVGIWGLIVIHFVLVAFPGAAQFANSNIGTSMILDVLTMFFAFLSLFAVFNILLRFLLNADVRKNVSVIDLGVVHHLMLALGAGIYAWAAIRPAPVWTGTVGNQLFVDVWTFKIFGTGYSSPAMLMPAMAKVHMILGITAFGALLHSKLVTILLIPRVNLWGIEKLFGAEEDSRNDALSVAAGLAGVTVVKKTENSDA